MSKTKIQKGKILGEVLKKAKKRILERNKANDNAQLSDLENKLNEF